MLTLAPFSYTVFIFVLRESEPGGAPGLVFLQIPCGFAQAIWIKLSLTHVIGFARSVAGGQPVGFVDISCVPRVRLRRWER